MTASDGWSHGNKSLEFARAKLVEIARAVGCSVEDFYQGRSETNEDAGLDELVGLSHAAPCSRTRQRILEFARQEVGRRVRAPIEL